MSVLTTTTKNKLEHKDKPNLLTLNGKSQGQGHKWRSYSGWSPQGLFAILHTTAGMQLH